MSGHEGPSPELFFSTLNAYQRTEALRAAINIDLFSKIGAEGATAAEIASQANAAERGVRILSDYLVICGFLTRAGNRYHLTRDSAVFLDRRSPAYMGGAVDFLLNPTLRDAFSRLTEAVGRGGAADATGTLAPEHPVWVDFARAMGPITALPAQLMAELVERPADAALSVLDIAASHGLFGIAFAKKFPKARVVAQDWANVLTVAKENARAAGVSDRVTLLPGDAFKVDLGTGHDVALVTNFLHHFDVPTCVQFLERIRAALKPGGVCLTLEFVLDDDRLGPMPAAGFPIIMLASTPSGDAYTFTQLDRMFKQAGFAGSELKSLMPGMQQVVVSRA